MKIEFLVNILICFILSFFIGLERQWRRRNIGLRTNVLVSLGSFLFVVLAVNLNISSDSTRIAAQVVSGIGFLGAGVILKDGLHIRGLNTAATLWCNAAIGVLCAYGFLFEAIVGTIFILISNILLRKLSVLMVGSYSQNDSNYLLTIVCKEKHQNIYRKEVIEWLEKNNISLESISTNELEDSLIKLKFYVCSRNAIELERLVLKLSIDTNIISISFKMISEDYKKALENDEV